LERCYVSELPQFLFENLFSEIECPPPPQIILFNHFIIICPQALIEEVKFITENLSVIAFLF
jgi:hypothetical protein